MLALSGSSAASRWVVTMPARSLSWTVTSTLRTVAWSKLASRLITDCAEITTRSPSGRLSFTANRYTFWGVDQLPGVKVSTSARVGTLTVVSPLRVIVRLKAESAPGVPPVATRNVSPLGLPSDCSSCGVIVAETVM